MVAFKSLAFKVAFTVMFAAIIWLCWRAWQVKDLRDLIVQAFQATMRITAMVAFILVGATCFSITFQGVDGNRWVEHLMSNLPGGVWGFLVVVNLFVFFLAFFLDFFEIAFIIVPMLAPVAQKILDAGGRPRRGADLVRRHAVRATCRPRSCIRRSASPCSICAAWRPRK